MMRFLRLSGVLVLVAVIGMTGCCKFHARNNLPPAQMLMEPGPGVGGPGPGISIYQPPVPVIPLTSQIAFVGPEGMTVNWDVTAPGRFDSEPQIAPSRYNFPQGAIYRMKLSGIPGRPGVELYPTLEVAPATPRTEAFLAHNAIPVQFTEEDFDQILSGNFVTKVIYLPDPEFQELAIAGVETLVSTRLDPGVDPIVEADRRGSILAIVRLGNKDLEVPGQIDAEGGVPGVPPAPGGVTQASYQQAMARGGAPVSGAPLGCPVGVPTTMPNPSSYIAGVTGPQYGMPMCGTPIGLPGPPHVPLGIPAGLQRHTIVNHTKVNIPGPTSHVRLDVRQDPGMSYPRPANHAYIVEKTSQPGGVYRQPHASKCQVSDACAPCYGDAACDSAEGCPVGGGNGDSCGQATAESW